MGLFSKKKVPSIDTGALLRISQDNEKRQKSIVGGLRGNLQPVYSNFENKRNTLGGQIQSGAENLIGQYGTDLSNVNAADTAARNEANVGFREQSFREVPEMQRAIRESLGGSGLLNSGAALSALSRPTLEANRASRDFTTQNKVAELAGRTGRAENLAGTGLNLRNQALSDRFGLDEGTINELYASGRGDLVDEANKFLGIEEQSGANRLGIEQARQQNEIAKAQAANAARGGLFSSVGSLIGTGAGALFGGPMGAALGSQLGGLAGNLAGGGSGGGTFDPTLLFAMGQRGGAPSPRRTAVVNSLGGEVPTYAPSRRQMGY